jgi:beta-ureidopropionase / N-carbamoyl-L-amino-acid hydrolase
MSGSGPVTDGMLSGLAEIQDIGRDPSRGGYSRHVWLKPELELREWFIERATRLGLDVETDRNGNLWAWWGAPGNQAVVTGSHLDSVPGGGAFDGPLGVVSALDAIARLQATGFVPSRPCAILVFAEEEGSRFGVACLGSRLMTGAIDPDRARALSDADGVSFSDAAARAGFDANRIGRDDAALSRIGSFIELHIEQGRGLIDLGSSIATATSILAHGRWRMVFRGEGNHAGATTMPGRHDPMIAAARSVVGIRNAALAQPGSRATVGHIEVVPNGTNAIPSRVTTWLDARGDGDDVARELVATIAQVIDAAAAAEGVSVDLTEESWSGQLTFDVALRDGLSAALGGVPSLPSGAGHDAGILASVVPTGMLFVRNPTGISHSPAEFATVEDCLDGVAALETVLRSLL